MMTSAKTSTSKRRRNPSGSAATIKEVAAQARVSVATVSRILNQKGPAREETRRRVLRATETLRYVPHAAARSLSIQKTHTVGVLLPDLHGEFFSEVIRGIDLAARASGYHLLVSGSHSDRMEMAAMVTSVRGRVDGMIIMSPDLDANAICSALPHNLPVVLVNCSARGHSSITLDNYGGSTAMVRHLVSLGHDRIAFIRGPEANADASERLRGYRAAMGEGASKRRSPMETDGNFTEEAGYEGVMRLLRESSRPSAIFAANDAMAIGALSALRRERLNVPGDVALAGFDDIPVARYVTPPLTTVNVSISSLGRRAFELLLARVASGQARSETLPTSLVVRESCGAEHPRTMKDQKRRRASVREKRVEKREAS